MFIWNSKSELKSKRPTEKKLIALRAKTSPFGQDEPLALWAQWFTLNTGSHTEYYHHNLKDEQEDERDGAEAENLESATDYLTHWERYLN